MPESHLNGAYYGPSIPPSSKTYHRPSRSSSGCCCNPFSCLCGCIFNCVCQIIITIAVILGVAALVLWLVLRPNRVKFHATDVSLTQFDLSTTNNTLYYNMAVNMTVRNPNKRIKIYYDRIEARAYYEGQRFATVNLDPFFQSTKNTTNLHALFQGQNLVLLGDREKSRYDEDRTSGMYDIEIKLYLRIRFKIGIIKTTKVKPKIECELRVPLNSNGRLSGTFESKRCGLDW